MNLKRQTFLLVVEIYQKRKNGLIWKSNTSIIKKELIPYKEVLHDTGAFKSSYLQLSNLCSNFLLKTNSLLSAKSNLSGRSMAYSTSSALDKQTCTDHVDFGKCQDRFGQFSWTKSHSNYLDIKLKVFKRENKNAEIRLRQIFPMGEVDFNQFIRQRKQLVVAADNSLREQNLSPFFQFRLSKDLEEQMKLFHKVVKVVNCPNRRIFVTLLRYKADKPETSYA